MLYPKDFPVQHQDTQPGLETLMNPNPISVNSKYKSSNKLINKVALITGGDSGIGKAVAIAFAEEGADIAISYYNEHEDAEKTKTIIESKGRKCVIFPGNIADEVFCNNLIQNVINSFGSLDILVNNAAVQYPQNSILDITKEQLELTFSTNFFSMFYLCKAAIPHLKNGSTIINTASVTAYEGHETLIDYSSTKGAIVSFTRSLSLNLSELGIRVNGVAPGPIWTPLIPSSFSKEKVAEFGHNTPIKRAGQPCEVAGAYVFLASEDSSYITGQFIHVNGGKIVNG